MVLDQCKIYGNSNQGVQTEGKMEICNSELYDHKFSAIRILKYKYTPVAIAFTN